MRKKPKKTIKVSVTYGDEFADRFARAMYQIWKNETALKQGVNIDSMMHRELNDDIKSKESK